MTRKLLIITLALCSGFATECKAQDMSFDMTKTQPVYSDETGCGYDVVTNSVSTSQHLIPNTQHLTNKFQQPFFFSVKVPDGNYRVTVVLGSKKKAGETTVRAENRRLMVEKCVTKKGQFKEYSFLVNKRDTNIEGSKVQEGSKGSKADKVKIKPGEVGSMTWDDKLTLEFNGASPCVKSITIAPDTTATTVFLCGNSTVVDQAKEPWASWGQMFTRWFSPLQIPQGGENKSGKHAVCIANYGESGLTATSFMAQNRLTKILTVMKPGDYVICEFGHNDEKEHGPGTGAWYHYTVALKKFVDLVREKKGNIIFCTPTVRRFFNNDGTIKNTHGDFPAAMKAVAERENVPLIDLNSETKTLFETMGEEGSKHLLVQYPMGTFTWQEKAFADNTHFNPFGAYEVSKIIVMGLKKLNSPLAKDITDDWVDFSPQHPDDYNAFYWPMSPLFDGKKPDGN